MRVEKLRLLSRPCTTPKSWRFKSSLTALILPVALMWTSVTYGQGVLLGSNVDELLSFALEKNPEFASMRYEAEAASERVNSADALPDPKFRTEWRDVTKGGDQAATLVPGRVGSTRYLLMQDIPWVGKRGLKRDAAISQADAALSKSSNTWRELAAKIKITYAELFYLEQSKRLNQEILDLMVRLEKVAQARYSGGLAAQQDVIRAQLEQTAMRSELIANDTERQQLQSKLNALIGRSTTEPLGSPTQVRPMPTTELVAFNKLEQKVLDNNPLLRFEGAQVQTLEKNRELTYKNRFPDLTLGVSPIQYGNSVREWELMLEINLPLQQSARRSQEREAEAMVLAARARRDQATNQIRAELFDNIAAYESAQKSLSLIVQSLLPQSELTFRSALAGYETGKVDFATLLDAQKQIRQAKLNQIKTALNAQTRLADIERIIGEEL